MKKATLKTYLITLLVLLLSFALMLTAFACKTTEEDPAEEDTETKSEFTSLVSNGDFSSVSGSTQPYTPGNWSTYTPDGYSADDKVAGVIDTGADYDKNRSAWDDLANPFGEVTDNKVLMIYNKAANVYGYTNTFTAEAYGYYKVSVKVKVVNAEGGGATFRISSSNGYDSFTGINATDAFTTYTFYLAAPSVDSITVTVSLSLGYQGAKVKGYAFFDDVVAEKILSADYASAQADTTLTNTKFVSMLYPDGEFNYYTDTNTLHTPTSWSEHKGANVDGKSLSTSYVKRGILSTDAESWDEESYGTNPALPVQDSADKNVLMLAANKSSANEYTPTAIYYSSKSMIRVDLASLYEISVWVKATVDNDDSILNYSNKGARVVLKGADDYSSAVINTTDKQGVNGGWAKVTFYILGNQFRNKDFTIELWLGDDENNDTLTQGKAYFDKLTINKVKSVSDSERNAVVSEYSAKEGNFETSYVSFVKFVNLVSVEDNLITNNNFTSLDEHGYPIGYEFAPVDNVKVKDNDVIVKVISKEELDSAEWTDALKEKYGIDSNPLYPYTLAPVLIVNNTIPAAYSMKTSDLLEIKQSLAYRISVWIKTIGLDKDSKVTLKLEDENGTEINSFSVNTADYTNEVTNHYAEYSFYFKGAIPTLANSTTNSNKVRLVISNGSGTTYDPASYKKGAFLVANINMEQITYKEYSNASSGTYVVKKDYSSNDATVTNGNFNSYDMDKTEIDQDTGFVAMTDKDGNDHLTAAISSWTNNVDSRYGTTKVSGSDLPSFVLTKGSDNSEASHTVSLGGKTITTIKMSGPDGYNKTFNTDSEWSKLLSVNNTTGKIKWASNATVTALTDGDYTITITVGEKELNNLIAGIINVNASADYLAQFSLTKEQIYDNWSTTQVPSDETKAKAIDFGAPNLLMITTRGLATITLKNTYVDDTAKNDMTKTAAIKSPSFSLSGNSYYLLKCYGKALGDAVGEVYITTTSTDAKVSSHTVKNTNGWVEYNFIVETGLSSVSAQFEIYYGEKGQGDTVYSGTLLFDSFSYVSMTEEEYLAASERTDTESSKFTTITFDNTSAAEKAVSPSGFSATNSSSANSDTQVSGIISKDTFEYVTSAGKNNLGIYETVSKTDDDGNETTEDVLMEGSSLSASEIFTDAGMTDGATVGDYLLMINNRKDTYQSYYLSGLSLASDSYYKFSAYVRTAKIAKEEKAKVYVSISNEPISFELNTEYDAEGNPIENRWQKLTFYFKNEKTSSVSSNLYFQLGENTDEGKMKGYLFIDNISLSKITEEEYTAETANYEVYEKDEEGNDETDANGNKILSDASKSFRLSNKVTVLKANESTDNNKEDNTDGEDNTKKSSINTTLLWTYITSIAIAVVLIAVIVIWLVRKYRRPKTAAATPKKADYDRTNSKNKEEEAAPKTGSARDEFKE